MAAPALGDVLQDFGKRAMHIGDRAAAAAGNAHTAGRADPAAVQQMIDAAVKEAEAALTARLAAEHEAALELERQRNAAEMVDALDRLGAETGTAVARRLAEMEEAVTSLATSATARILAVHLSADVQKRMIEALGETIRAAIGDREAVRIKVQGPLSLHEALRGAMGDMARHLEYSETAAFDLSVSIDDSLFETRLSEWAAALAEALS